MSIKVKFNTGIELNVQVRASVTPFRRGRGPSMDHAGGEPDEPAEIEDLEVFVSLNGQLVDITEYLPEDVLESLRDQAVEEES